MEQFAIGANFESAAARGNQRERFDALAELKDLGRQTDSLRRVISNDAVFDRDFGFHRQTPFRNETIDVIGAGQDSRSCCSPIRGKSAAVSPEGLHLPRLLESEIQAA